MTGFFFIIGNPCKVTISERKSIDGITSVRFLLVTVTLNSGRSAFLKKKWMDSSLVNGGALTI